MRVTESPFKTEFLGYPIAPGVLRHNAYVAGWEHGGADFRPSGVWWDQMHALGLAAEYEEGRADGANARGLAWAKAQTMKGETDARGATSEPLETELELVRDVRNLCADAVSGSRYDGVSYSRYAGEDTDAQGDAGDDVRSLDPADLLARVRARRELLAERGHVKEGTPP